jgi:hypothetical protein
MNEEHGRRCSKILLDAHETIVHQIVTTKCAHKCPPRIARKSLNKNLATEMHSCVGDNKLGSSIQVRSSSFYV